MRNIGFLAFLLVASASAAEPGRLRPVPFEVVRIDDEFWRPRIDLVCRRTLPHVLRMCEQTGRIANWEKAARREGEFEGYFFNDSDVYKAMEAAAYVLHHEPHATFEGRPLAEYLDGLIDKIAAMQWPDGYVNSYFSLRSDEPRWTNIEVRHELYCAGHLIEAAVAHHRMTGRRNFLDVALRLADHICDTFGPGRKADPCGHPEIELALLRLAELCRGESAERAGRYSTLARFFIDQHGRREGREKLWGEYAQDHLPLVEQRAIVGHAVRAMYFYSAASEIAGANPDAGYHTALDAIWRDLTNRKMYITGGIGPSAHNEGFTVPYDLPNDSAYAETCAAIGLAFWAQRMNRLHGEARYADVLERVLYNGMLAGLSLDGRAFFYTNPLGSRGQHQRTPWYDCACCPPNLARFIPTIGGYVYATGEDAIYVNLFVGSGATIRLRDDLSVSIRQETRYPWDGRVRISVEPSRPATFALFLRRPDWCNRWSVGSRPREIADLLAPQRGYLGARREWRAGDSLEIVFDMPVRRMEADPRVRTNVGRVALVRGPIVYCLEGADHAGRVRNLALPRDAPLSAEHRSDLLDGVTVLRGTALAVTSTDQPDDEPLLYRPVASVQPGELAAMRFAVEPREFVAIPYFAWNNRGPGEMVVWLPESPALCEPSPVAWLRPSASHCWRTDTTVALHDRLEPAGSSDESIARFTWWPRRGSVEWVQYDFDGPRRVRGVAVYWFDDTKAGGRCAPPAAWKLLARVGGQWHVVAESGAAGGATDRFDEVSFEPIETDGLRIEAQLRENLSAGILEWRVLTTDSNG